MVKLFHGDCLELMKNIPNNSVDLVLTDPPYKIVTGGMRSGFSHKTGNIFKNSGMKNCEYIIFCRKGKARTIYNPSSQTVLEFKNIKNKKHPTEKPIDLLSVFIENSSKINELVLDPFMGSGSAGIACKNLNRKFIGIEKDDSYLKIAKQRIESKI